MTLIADSDRDPIITTYLEAWTTDVRGRFVLAGDRFQLVADSSIATGGPGQAMDSYALLVSSLASCVINVLRGAGGIDTEVVPSRSVRIAATHLRDVDDEGLGTLTVEAFIAGVSDAEADNLVEHYKSICKIYNALRPSMNIVVIGHAESQSSVTESGPLG